MADNASSNENLNVGAGGSVPSSWVCCAGGLSVSVRKKTKYLERRNSPSSSSSSSPRRCLLLLLQRAPPPPSHLPPFSASHPLVHRLHLPSELPSPLSPCPSPRPRPLPSTSVSQTFRLRPRRSSPWPFCAPTCASTLPPNISSFRPASLLTRYGWRRPTSRGCIPGRG